jgi:hypothetical protein
MDWLRELHSYSVQASQANDGRSVRRKVTETLSDTALNPKFFLEQIGMPHIELPAFKMPIYQVGGATAVTPSLQEAPSVSVAAGLGPIAECKIRFSKTEARLQAQCVFFSSRLFAHRI